MTFDVPLIDAHHHLAWLDLGYPWLGAEAPVDRYHGDDRALRRDYAIEEYRADSEGLPLVASVHVENGAADPLAEARWIGEVIAAHGPIPAVHVAARSCRHRGPTNCSTSWARWRTCAASGTSSTGTRRAVVAYGPPAHHDRTAVATALRRARGAGPVVRSAGLR